MRCAFLFSGLFSLGLFLATGELMAQPSYYSASAPNYGFAPQPENWQPNVTPNRYPQAAAGTMGQRPVGSGLPSALPQPSGQQSAGPYPAALQSAGQYPAAQYPEAQYPSAQYPSAPQSGGHYPSVQVPATGQYPPPTTGLAPYQAMPSVSPAYSPPASLPGMGYRRLPAGNATVQTPSGRLFFEASSYDASSLGGPNPGPGAPAYTAPQHQSPAAGSVLQHGVPQTGPAVQSWTTEAPCGPDGCGPPVYSTPASRWFAGVYGLIMTRDQENNLWLSYDTNDIRQRVLTTHDADANYTGGVEARFGRCFGDGNSAFEVVYWGIIPGTEEANVFGADLVGDLDTILHFDGISFDPGTGPQLVSTAYFQAERHRLQRDYNLHNLELNLLETNFVQPCGCANVKLSWAAGIRYVKFDESFLYSTDPVDTVFTGAPQELHYGVETENDLIGFQIGGRADVCFKPGLTSYLDTKMGLFANRSSQQSRISGSNGLAEVSDVVSPYFGTPLDIRSTKTDMAFVAELRAGLDYQFTPCWSATIGYRALALTGVALSTNQVPVDFIGAIDSLRSVDTNGCLIAHGAFAGLEYCH